MRRPGLCLLALLCLVCAAGSVPLYRDSLPNGLVLLTYEDPRLPAVDLKFVCRSGASHDPSGKAGLAGLTNGMLLRGTRTRTAADIDELIEFLGARVRIRGDHDHQAVEFKLLSRHLDTILGLLSDIILNPGFGNDELATERARALSSARYRYENPGAVAVLEFDRLLFQGHPYARPASGDTVDLKNLERNDLVAFHQTHYLPNNCFLIAVGDVDHVELGRKVADLFGDWQPGPVPVLDVPKLSFPEKLTVKVITRPGLNQSYVALGNPGIAISHPDMLTVRVMSFILGGSATASRFGQTVREAAGLAYDVRCWFDRRTLPGAYRATVQTADPKAAVGYMLRDIGLMIDSSATARELEIAQNYYSGSYPLRYSSARGKLYEVTDMELYGLGSDWLDLFPDRIRSITLDDIRAAARNHLYPGRHYAVIVTNLSKEDLGLEDVIWVD
ncbi:MAG: insulinase family protein [candidate division WOR-3 bacterium]|nr:MAG: insulinase family protein [candidate division WOR-3 bacterium]